MKLSQVTNPAWVAYLAPLVEQYCKKAAFPNTSYHAMVTYLQASVQNPNVPTELWVVVDDENEPIAFAHWGIKGMPFVATVHCDAMYSSDKEAVGPLMEQLGKYADHNNCVWFSGDIAKRKAAEAVLKRGRDYGLEFIVTPLVYVLGRKGAKPEIE